MKEFTHEKLDVYQTSIQFVRVANEIALHLPRGRAHLADHLQRSASAIALNVAEGAGELSSKEKTRFYRMARHSVTECAAILDVCRQVAQVDSMKHQTGHELLLRMVAQLTRLISRETH